MIFNLATPLPTGTFSLDVSGVLDPFGNLLAPNPTRLAVTAMDTQRPTLVSVAKVSGTELRVTFSERMKGAGTDPASAGNPSNYSVEGSTYGSLCSLGAVTIDAEPPAPNGQQTFRIVCGASGSWSAAGTHTLTVKDVQDVAGNVINPNPAGPLSFQ